MKRPDHSTPKKRSKTRRQFHQQIKNKSTRKLKARQEEKYNIWQGLGMFGIVGWSIAVPILIGIAIGLWLDFNFPSRFSWALILLLVGAVIGCLNAWYWVHRESRDE